MGALIFFGMLVPFVPSDAVVITTFFLKRRRWFLIAVFFAFCAASSATLLAHLLSVYGETLLSQVSQDGFTRSGTWLDTKVLIQNYGAGALGILSLSPIPQQPGIIAAGLAHLELPKIFAAFMLARTLKYSAYRFFLVGLPARIKKAHESGGSRRRSKVSHPPPV